MDNASSDAGLVWCHHIVPNIQISLCNRIFLTESYRIVPFHSITNIVVSELSISSVWNYILVTYMSLINNRAFSECTYVETLYFN